MRIEIYEHRSGLKVVPQDVIQMVSNIINELHPTLTKNSVTQIKKDIKHRLEVEGWTGELRLDATSKITITSYLAGIGLCLQTGNIGRIYADMLKLQTLYTKEKIIAGIIIAPVQRTAKLLGSNMANYERISRELPIFNQVITMPIVVIGFDGTEVT